MKKALPAIEIIRTSEVIYLHDVTKRDAIGLIIISLLLLWKTLTVIRLPHPGTATFRHRPELRTGEICICSR